jgi:hypothetical protein
MPESKDEPGPLETLMQDLRGENGPIAQKWMTRMVKGLLRPPPESWEQMEREIRRKDAVYAAERMRNARKREQG